MRVLLRSLHTGLFYAGPDKWTADGSHAIDFQETTQALDKAAEDKMQAMEVVMHFEEPALDIPLTIFSAG